MLRFVFKDTLGFQREAASALRSIISEISQHQIKQHSRLFHLHSALAVESSNSRDGAYNNGPDQIVPSNSYITTARNGFVKIRSSTGDSMQSNEIPVVSIPTTLKRAREIKPDHPALLIKRDSKWQTWTYTDYYQDVRTVAKAFIKLGLEPRLGVAIMGVNAPEWFISNLAAVFAGGIGTGIYTTSSADIMKYILLHSKANILVVDDEEKLDKFWPIRHDLPDLKAVIQFTGDPQPKYEGVMSWKELLKVGNQQEDYELEERLKKIAINECCHMVYTSGTTGPPKAVMLSHDNLNFAAVSMVNLHDMLVKGVKHVSYLPLSHVAAMVADIVAGVNSCASVYFADKDALKGTLVQTLKEVQPTIFLGVPRVFEKMQEKMQEVGKSNTGIKKLIANWAKKTGMKHNQKIIMGKGISKTWSYRIADQLVFQKVKEALGLNNCGMGVYTAAAPISRETVDYFLSLDIPVLDIYGLSECAGPHCINILEKHRPGSSGKTFPGMETAIRPLQEHQLGFNKNGEIGEIEIWGRHVMMGYLDDMDKTLEAVDSFGWLHTGDTGYIDKDGFLFITGRIKDIFITSGGETVVPLAIEDTIKAELPCLSNVMVIGDNRKFISCLLTFQTEVDVQTQEPTERLSDAALEFCQSVGSTAKTTVDVIKGDPAVMAGIQAGVDRANLKVPSNAQKVKKWAILPRQFSVPGGEFGPTLKLRRHFVIKIYHNLIESFYK